MAATLTRLARRQGSCLLARHNPGFQFLARHPLSSSSSSSAPAAVGASLDLGAGTSLQKARTWDEGVESQFATSSLSDVFKGKKVVIFGVPGAFTGVCTKSHVPSYLSKVEEFKAKGVDSVICTAVNDPYTLKAWADQMGAKNIDFLADYNGSFHKLLGLDLDLSVGLLGSRSQRWAAVVDDGVFKVLEVESSPGDLEVTKADNILKQL